MLKIVVFASDQTIENEIVVSKDDFLIGRSSASDVRIPDQTISGKHVRVQVANERVRITDLGSTNGTWIDGQAVYECVVDESQQVRLGSRQIAFHVQQAEPAAIPMDKTSLNHVRCRAAGIPVEFAVEDSPDEPANDVQVAFPLQTILLSQLPMLIGSGGHCPCQLKSGDVVAEHARLTRCGEQFEIMSIHSQFPVCVNGEAVAKKRLLKWGDVIAIGSYTFRVQPVDQSSDTVQSTSAPRKSSSDTFRISKRLPEKTRSWSQWISGLMNPLGKRRSA